jgi:hypothetical protein
MNAAIVMTELKRPTVRPTVVIPDTAPLIHVAAADALLVLNAMGRVVIPDL